MNISELKPKHLGVMLDSSVIVLSPDLVNAFIQDPSFAIKALQGLESSITKEQVKVDDMGCVRISNAGLTKSITDKINSAVIAAGDNNYGFC